MLEAEKEHETFAREIKDIEHAGDRLTHDIIDKLNKTFVTPFDREDIYSLAKVLDKDKKKDFLIRRFKLKLSTFHHERSEQSLSSNKIFVIFAPPLCSLRLCYLQPVALGLV